MREPDAVPPPPPPSLWLFFPPNSIEQAKIMKQYGNEVGLAAFAWLETTNGLSFHHMELPHGRTLSCHHTNSIAGKTIDVSTCASSTCTQTWGGRSTFYHGYGEVYLSSSHISEPLFPGGTSVFPVLDITPPPNLPHSCTAPWSLLHRQNTKTNSIQSMHDFTILSIGYPPILGDMQMTKKCPKLYMNIERTNASSPSFCPFLGGGGWDIAHFGGYWHILLSIMCKKWGNKSFMMLARIIHFHYLPWFNLCILNCRSHSLFRFIEDRSLFQLCQSHLFLFLIFNLII